MLCLGGGLGVGRPAVAAGQLDAGLGLRPHPNRYGVTIRQEIDDVAYLEVDDVGAVALSLTPSPVVDTDKSIVACLRTGPRLLDTSQQRIGAGWQSHFLCQSRSGFNLQGRAEVVLRLSESSRRVRVPGRKAVERLDEDLACSCGIGAEKSRRGHPETDTTSQNRFSGKAARVLEHQICGRAPLTRSFPNAHGWSVPTPRGASQHVGFRHLAKARLTGDAGHHAGIPALRSQMA